MKINAAPRRRPQDDEEATKIPTPVPRVDLLALMANRRSHSARTSERNNVVLRWSIYAAYVAQPQVIGLAALAS